MTEEEQRQEVAVWGENMNLMKDCSLEKTDEDLYYNTEWDYTCEESELEPEDKNDPDVHKVYEAGMHYIYSKGNFIFILNANGKYLTSLYASLAAGTSLNISDNIAAHENHIECYRLATDSEKQRMIKALKKSENPKAKEYLKRFFGIKEEPKYDFKPFDKVLVRKEGNKKWNISLFAREIVDDYNGLPYKYECSNGTLWDYCIHFEGNECLLGTTENPEK